MAFLSSAEMNKLGQRGAGKARQGGKSADTLRVGSSDAAVNASGSKAAAGVGAGGADKTAARAKISGKELAGLSPTELRVQQAAEVAAVAVAASKEEQQQEEKEESEGHK